MRTGEGSITCLRKPWKLPGPALPASMKVVTPPVRASSSASTPKRRAAPVDVGVQVDQAGRDDLAFDVARVLAGEAIADRRDLAAGEGDVGHLVDALRGIDEPAAFENQIVHFTIHR